MKRLWDTANPENYFWLKDGTALKNLNELGLALGKMSDDVFKHHVSSQRNDFYNWVKDIYQDQKLATKLLKSKTKEEMMHYIQQRLDEIKMTKKKADVKVIKTKKRTEKKENITKKIKLVKKTKKVVKKTIKTKKPEIAFASPHVTLLTHLDTKQLIDKSTIGRGIAVAAASLAGLVALINLLQKPKITGAAIATGIESSQYNWFVIIISLIIIAFVMLIPIIKKR